MNQNNHADYPSLPVVVYRSDIRQKTGFFVSLFFMFRNVFDSRELIWQLFKRDFLASYRKSFLGLSWLVLAPLFGIISWIFMNMAGVLRPGDVGIPYPAYVLLGTTLWGLFMSFYQMAADTLNVGKAFIMQVKYHHEVLLAKQILQALANFVVVFFVVISVLLLFRVTPNWKTVFVPLLILPMLFLGSGIGIVISAVGVVAVEIRKVVDMFFGMLIFFTPIIYSGNATTGTFSAVVRWNPLTYIVGGVRDIIAYGRMDNPAYFFITAAVSFVIFLISWRLFYISEDKVIEKML